ncbi:unnamed protein product [Microthlaspi erraticum]|uniref:DUF1985 domain-containing protein n=1 Tax=Microthlaspi erraticum TaxID=1685480 RepID=A0A6D2JUY9_9BRAS|nr:unnamed protein product [Microthlaspi erraticum]
MTEDSVMVGRKSTGNRGEDIAKEAVAVKDNSRRSKSGKNDDEGPSTSKGPSTSTLPPMDAGESTEPIGIRDVPESTREDKLDENLPKKVFAVDCYPEPGRMNIYSKANVIGRVADALAGTPALKTIHGSQFRQLFMLPVGRCSYSGKLIHAILARQLVPKRKYEIWSVFGGQSFRFSFREFERVSGLVCSRIPEGHTFFQAVPKEPSTTWKELFRRNCKQVSVECALNKLKEKHISDRKRLYHALIILVDGVVLGNKPPNITPTYVDMVEDVEKFLRFPWGRFRTLSRFRPAPLSPKNPDPINELKQRLRQQTSACYGFPLAVELVVFEASPLLVEKLADPKKTTTFLEEPFACETAIVRLQSEDILHVEANPKLTFGVDVTEGENADPDWDDEVHDDGVDRIVQLLQGGHVFTQEDFVVGQSTMAPVFYQPQGDRYSCKVKLNRGKKWMADQFRTMTEKLVEAIRSGGGEGGVSKVTDQTSKRGSEMQPENRGENVFAKSKGKSEEGEDVRDIYVDMDDV